jgi:hypothetical protein
MANTANNNRGNFYNNMSSYVDGKAKKDDAVKAMLPDVLQYADKALQQKAIKGESATIYKDVIDNAISNLPESIDNQLTQASFDKFDQRYKDEETVGLGVIGDKYVDVTSVTEKKITTEVVLTPRFAYIDITGSQFGLMGNPKSKEFGSLGPSLKDWVAPLRDKVQTFIRGQKRDLKSDLIKAYKKSLGKPTNVATVTDLKTRLLTHFAKFSKMVVAGRVKGEVLTPDQDKALKQWLKDFPLK